MVRGKSRSVRHRNTSPEVKRDGSGVYLKHSLDGCIISAKGVLKMRKDRFIVGIICIALAVWMFLAGVSGGTVAPAIAVLILGITMIAIWESYSE